MIFVIGSILHRWCRSYIETNSLILYFLIWLLSANPSVQVSVGKMSQQKWGYLWTGLRERLSSRFKKWRFSKYCQRSAEYWKAPHCCRAFMGFNFFVLFLCPFYLGTEAILVFHRTGLTVIGFYLVFQVLVKGLSGVGSSVFLSIGFVSWK